MTESCREAETLTIMRWYVTQTPKRKRLAMACGGIADVVNESYLHLLKYPPKGEWELSTVACNAVRWTLSKMYHRICRMQLVGLFPTVYSNDDVVAECELREMKIDVWKVVNTLPRRMPDIVRRRILGESLEDVAKSHGISRERVRQIECEGYKLLMHKSRSSRLSSHMPGCGG